MASDLRLGRCFMCYDIEWGDVVEKSGPRIATTEVLGCQVFPPICGLQPRRMSDYCSRTWVVYKKSTERLTEVGKSGYSGVVIHVHSKTFKDVAKIVWDGCPLPWNLSHV